MTYLKDGAEYLDADEFTVYCAIIKLNDEKRTTNNSQLASAAGLPRVKVGTITARLLRRGFIKDTGKGAAYHWRVTGKPAQRESA